MKVLLGSADAARVDQPERDGAATGRGEERAGEPCRPHDVHGEHSAAREQHRGDAKLVAWRDERADRDDAERREAGGDDDERFNGRLVPWRDACAGFHELRRAERVQKVNGLESQHEYSTPHDDGGYRHKNPTNGVRHARAAIARDGAIALRLLGSSTIS